MRAAILLALVLAAPPALAASDAGSSRSTEATPDTDDHASALEGLEYIHNELIPLGLKLLALLVTIGLMIATFVGMQVSGPVRWVRLMSVAVFVCGIVSFGLFFSPRAALGLFGLIALTTSVSVIIGALLWASPATQPLVPHPFDPPDKLLEEKAAHLTEQAEGAGLEQAGDYLTEWRFAGQQRKGWDRLFRHPEQPHLLAEIGVLVQPKLAAFRLLTRLSDGRVVETCNRRTNAAALRDPKTISIKTPESASVEQMLAAHRAEVARVEDASPEPVDDPPRVAEQLYDEWAARMIELGKLVRRGDQLKVRLSAAPAIALQSLADLVRG